MDWMAQGTHITGNLCYNNTLEDLYCEVDHGPYLVDNNIFLSEIGLRDWSEGGAFVHNLFTGKIIRSPDSRTTPYHKPHSTEVVALKNLRGGDNRFYNNIFVAGYAPTARRLLIKMSREEPDTDLKFTTMPNFRCMSMEIYITKEQNHSEKKQMLFMNPNLIPR